ncbi:hypothetical protein LSH36_437g02101 [Paralvinella palmiformis]|uniref:DnaJ homolog subfamily C member 21 n=1 Tax=Paralvinella palmiformis TaxID=53620 RepID=A0AAD9JB00_9ANNE|nr:hypothetical protein LSH36_437g02101 [Paralvinella palmiformis]
MRCHYEILNISRDANDDDIKKSYRKLALKFHPDKNPENIEECTRQFHLIQQAYDVLIDPQERAWYDKHREAILRGGLGRGDDYEDNSLDVYQYFNTGCFSGYGDDEKGFYAVYSKVFETIAAEDLEFMDEEDSDFEFPPFGNSQSSYEEVVAAFYAFWESYCTAKSYVWAEKYDTREAPNRQIRRLMEQDNKKLRDKAKKEHNEEVRALVGFVRKRDKRVQARKKYLEERAAEIAKKSEEKKRRDREQRLKELENYTEANWSAMSALEKDLEKLDANYAEQFGEELDTPSDDEGEEEENEGTDDYLDDFFCVACNKEFKTEKAYANHERSKKHKENTSFLKAQMLAEEAVLFDLHENNKISAEGDQAAGGIETRLTDDETESAGDEDISNMPKIKLSKKQKKKRKQQQKLLNMKNKVENDLDNAVNELVLKESLKVEDNSESSKKIETVVNIVETDNDNELEADPSSDSVNQLPETSLGGTINGTVEKTNEKKKTPQKDTIPQICHHCSQSFPSRNKLFQHIKETGHALRIEHSSDVVKPETGKNKKKRKGKR